LLTVPRRATLHRLGGLQALDRAIYAVQKVVSQGRFQHDESVWPPVHDVGMVLTGVKDKGHPPSGEYITNGRAFSPGKIDVKNCNRDVCAGGDVNGLTYTRRGKDFGTRVLKYGGRVRRHEAIVLDDENPLPDESFTHYVSPH
jgi:hypothetical protein